MQASMLLTGATEANRVATGADIDLVVEPPDQGRSLNVSKGREFANDFISRVLAVLREAPHGRKVVAG